MSYTVVETKDHQAWDSWVRASHEGTIFHTTDYLRALDCDYKLYFVQKGNTKKAAFLAPVTPDGRDIIAATFLIYGGFLFHDEEADHQPRQQKDLSLRFRITEALVEYIGRTFDKIHISCGPAIKDLRPFLWYNYPSNDPGQQYRLALRYTSYLNIQGINQHASVTHSPNFQQLSRSRRQEIRHAIHDGISAFESSDLHDFLRLSEISRTNRNDDVKFLQREYQVMSSVMQALIKNGQGKLYYVKDDTGQVVAGSFWGLDVRRAYFLFAANHPQAKQRHTGTMALWDAFRHLNRMYQVREVDLEGVNSPQRGWFKLSFGGDIRPYYHVSLRRS